MTSDSSLSAKLFWIVGAEIQVQQWSRVACVHISHWQPSSHQHITAHNDQGSFYGERPMSCIDSLRRKRVLSHCHLYFMRTHLYDIHLNQHRRSGRWLTNSLFTRLVVALGWKWVFTLRLVRSDDLFCDLSSTRSSSGRRHLLTNAYMPYTVIRHVGLPPWVSSLADGRYQSFRISLGAAHMCCVFTFVVNKRSVMR